MALNVMKPSLCVFFFQSSTFGKMEIMSVRLNCGRFENFHYSYLHLFNSLA